MRVPGKIKHIVGFIRFQYWFPNRIHGRRAAVRIDPTAEIHGATLNTESGTITIGPWALFGSGVSLLTGTHDLTKFGKERQDSVPRTGRDIVVEEGAWLGSNSTVIGPCVIGKHAVVAAGALVRHDVAPYTVVGGLPARVLRTLPVEDASPSDHAQSAPARSDPARSDPAQLDPAFSNPAPRDSPAPALPPASTVPTPAIWMAVTRMASGWAERFAPGQGWPPRESV